MSHHITVPGFDAIAHIRNASAPSTMVLMELTLRASPPPSPPSRPRLGTRFEGSTHRGTHRLVI